MYNSSVELVTAIAAAYVAAKLLLLQGVTCITTVLKSCKTKCCVVTTAADVILLQH
jgi:hypothetical protein